MPLRLVVAGALVLLAATLLLSLVPMPTVEFGMTATGHSVTFGVAEDTQLEELQLLVADISGRGSVQVIDAAQPVEEMALTAGAALRAESATAPMRLKSVVLPRGAEFRLQADGADVFRLTQQPTPAASRPVTFVLLVPKAAHVSLGRGDSQKQLLPQEMDVRIEVMSPDLLFQTAPGQRDLMLRAAMSRAFLQETKRRQTDQRRAVISLGSIREGRIWIRHALEPQQDLGPLDRITADGLTGAVANLRLSKDVFTLEMRGHADSLTDALGERPRSLKPSLLAALSQDTTAKALFAIVTLFAGVQVSSAWRRRS